MIQSRLIKKDLSPAFKRKDLSSMETSQAVTPLYEPMHRGVWGGWIIRVWTILSFIYIPHGYCL